MNYLFITHMDSAYNIDTPNYVMEYKDRIYEKFSPIGFSKWNEIRVVPKWILDVYNLLFTKGTFKDKVGIVVMKNELDKEGVKFSVKELQPSYIFVERNKYLKFFIEKLESILVDTDSKLIIIGDTEYDYSIADIAKELGVYGESEINYKILGDVKHIPTITLSSGCKHACTFCNTNKDLVIKDFEEVLKKVSKMNKLNFELVRITDEVFGDMPNYKVLGLLYDEIVSYNNSFKGFIVQSSPHLLKNDKFCKELQRLGVNIVEMELDAVTDELLEKYNKPYSIADVRESIQNLIKYNLKIVPSIIINSPHKEEDVETIELFMREIEGLILYFNIYNYTNDFKSNNNVNDSNRDAYHKSWIEETKARENLFRIYNIAKQIIK